MADKWEYWTGILYANINDDGVKEYLNKRWPDWKAPQFSTQALIPGLNMNGLEGWEVITFQPITSVLPNGMLAIKTIQATNAYLVMMKRKIE